MSIKKGTVTIASSTPVTEWGSVEGTLSDQVDLNNALLEKANLLSPEFTGTPTVPLASQETDNNQIASTKFVHNAIETVMENIEKLPDQLGQSGKFLTTNGAYASWGNIPAELPSQLGQSGKVLSTNGSTAQWIEYSPTPDTDGTTVSINSSDKLQAIGTIEKNTSSVKYDWVGTYDEWVAGRTNNSIPDSWICYITDDYVQSTVTHNIGDIFYSLRTEDIMNGAVVCNGAEYDINDYSEGSNSLKSLLDGGKIPYVSIATFDATVTSKGSCRCFGYDSGSTFKVPKLNDVFVECGTANSANEFIDAGLPNITGNTGNPKTLTNTAEIGTPQGALYVYSQTSNDYGHTSAGTSGRWALGFDASRSNQIYGNSDTVQPNAVKYRAFIQIANEAPESALQTVSSVVNDVTTLQEEMTETLKYKNITNCITEIPQDIKLEIDTTNNTITLKAGSKVYIPNGFEQDGTTPKFDIYTLTSDIVKTDFGSGSGTQFLTVQNTNYLYAALVSDSGSGTSTSSTNGFYYRTDLNTIYPNNDTTKSKQSFPVAIITKTNGSVTSIDQVFNGFGYIGSTIFVLPGVKGLVPNGRNADGSLKSLETGPNNVLVYNLQQDTTTANIYLSTNYTSVWYYHDDYVSETLPNEIYSHVYIPSKNEYWYTTDTVNYARCYEFPIATISFTNGVIKSFEPRTPFKALDYNDRKTITSWSMPSNKYIDLTSTSGSTFTAPSNGYVVFKNNNTGTSNVQAYIENQTKNMISTVSSYYNNGGGFLPVNKGDIIYLYKNSGVSVIYYRFIYAEGEI